MKLTKFEKLIGTMFTLGCAFNILALFAYLVMHFTGNMGWTLLGFLGSIFRIFMYGSVTYIILDKKKR